MKKLYVILALAFFCSCKKDNNSNTTQETIDFKATSTAKFTYYEVEIDGVFFADGNPDNLPLTSNSATGYYVEQSFSANKGQKVDVYVQTATAVSPPQIYLQNTAGSVSFDNTTSSYHAVFTVQ